VLLFIASFLSFLLFSLRLLVNFLFGSFFFCSFLLSLLFLFATQGSFDTRSKRFPCDSQLLVGVRPQLFDKALRRAVLSTLASSILFGHTNRNGVRHNTFHRDLLLSKCDILDVLGVFEHATSAYSSQLSSFLVGTRFTTVQCVNLLLQGLQLFNNTIVGSLCHFDAVINFLALLILKGQLKMLFSRPFHRGRSHRLLGLGIHRFPHLLI